ncbi:MAG: hypothetical protein M1132_10720 [Chloroflexi bacterium]|nr:hypothetical protein [Chloroflexota bacterium]
MDNLNQPVEVRAVRRRGCGYPKPGGVYLESMGEPGGTLPIIVLIDPPVEHDHFHRSYVYIDLDELLSKRQVNYVGASVASAEEWHLRQRFEGIARDVFGDSVRIKSGQVIRFRDTAARVLTDARWKPGVRGVASDLEATRILREHLAQLAPLVEIVSRQGDGDTATDSVVR